LVAGETWDQILLSIENNQLRFRPELNDIDDPPPWKRWFWTVGGAWPDNAWLALSGASDAGPSSADVYHWRDSRWVKQREHARGILDLALWRGNLVLQGSLLAVPMMVEQQLHEVSGSKTKSLNPTLCSAGGATLLAPLRVHDGALSLFGYECPKNGEAPEQGAALVVETWTASGTRSKRRSLLPDDLPWPDQLVIDQAGLAAVLPKHEQQPPRLARFIAGAWQTVAVLPATFSRVPAPRSFELWGVVESQLRCWQGGDWSVMALPTDTLPPGAHWKSVWRRAPGDVWLLAGSADKSWLFNSADGKSVTPLPSNVEREAIGERMSRERSECRQPFADVLVLQPHQLGEDVAVTLSPERARRMLKAALARSPRFQHLQFVRHGCYGEDCVGALVKDEEEAQALRAALVADTQIEPAVEKFARGEVRCSGPPASEPFPVVAR
jgi:hypothetical protein